MENIIKHKKEKIWWLYLRNFYKRYLQNLKYNVKRARIFQLILVGILSILILSVKNRRVLVFLLNAQNLLSETTVGREAASEGATVLHIPFCNLSSNSK